MGIGCNVCIKKMLFHFKPILSGDFKYNLQIVKAVKITALQLHSFCKNLIYIQKDCPNLVVMTTPYQSNCKEEDTSVQLFNDELRFVKGVIHLRC